MVYIYAITDRPNSPMPRGPGIMGASLLSVAYRELSAVVSCLPAPDVPISEENLWRHEAVVEALMADRAVLPAGFGTVVASEVVIRTVIAERYDDFVANLERVRSHVELGLRVLWDGERAPPASDQRRVGSGQTETAAYGESDPTLRMRRATSDNAKKADRGTAYLLSKLQEERERRAVRKRAEALVAKLQTPLTRLATQTTCDLLLTPRFFLKAAYLVRQDRIEAFLGNVENLSAAHRHVRILCTGPWPPYNFVAQHPLSGCGHGGADA